MREATTSGSTFPPPRTAAWSRRERASRTDPSASLAMIPAASADSPMDSSSATRVRCSVISPAGTRRKSNRWQRPTIVAGILCGSVVARTKRTPGGGSSNTLSSASKASRESRWASSMM